MLTFLFAFLITVSVSPLGAHAPILSNATGNVASWLRSQVGWAPPTITIFNMTLSVGNAHRTVIHCKLLRRIAYFCICRSVYRVYT